MWLWVTTNIKEKEAEIFNRIVEDIFINEQRGSESESDAEEWKEVKCCSTILIFLYFLWLLV